MEMKASDNNAKASDPIDDFIVLEDRKPSAGTIQRYLSSRMYTDCVLKPLRARCLLRTSRGGVPE